MNYLKVIETIKNLNKDTESIFKKQKQKKPIEVKNTITKMKTY